MTKPKAEISYSDAISEITQIIHEIEQNQVDIDLLSEKVKRVTFLLDFCKNKLKNTEEQTNKILNKSEE
jgi:exodeoxyribonuclease VII small subunit